MKQHTPRKKKDMESVQASDWNPTYNEPSFKQEKDEMPKGDVLLGTSESKAVLRLKIEKLLQRREAAPNDMWLLLGKDAVPMLLLLLQDVSFLLQPEIRHKIITALGQLNAVEAVPDIGNILISNKETELTQTYAANALGRIGDSRIVTYLGQAVLNKHSMVRRQVAIALGKSQNTDAIPYLLKLQEDPAQDVIGAAITSLREFQKNSETKLKIRAWKVKQHDRKIKLRPKEDE